MTSQASIDQMVQRIVERFHPVRVILFGSHARGTARPDSDVDLLVVTEEVVDPRKLTIEMRRAVGDLPVSKDIIATTEEGIRRRGHLLGSVLRSALREGKVLYERP